MPSTIARFFCRGSHVNAGVQDRSVVEDGDSENHLFIHPSSALHFRKSLWHCNIIAGVD